MQSSCADQGRWALACHCAATDRANGMPCKIRCCVQVCAVVSLRNTSCHPTSHPPTCPSNQSSHSLTHMPTMQSLAKSICSFQDPHGTTDQLRHALTCWPSALSCRLTARICTAAAQMHVTALSSPEQSVVHIITEGTLDVWNAGMTFGPQAC